MAIQAKSSRLCVKNLPAYLDEKKLKATFSRMGEVTDVKIMKTKEGKSRKFGFVGFKDEEMAKKAKDYFDRSFIDTSRVVVEYAIPVGQGALGKPKSKHSNVVEDEQKFQVIENVQEKESKSQENTEKSQDMTEFLSIMQPRSSKAAEKFWSNDDAIASKNASANQIVSKNEKSAAEKLMFDDDDSGDDEDVNDMSGPLKTLSEDEDDKEFAARFGKQSEIKNSAIQEDESSDDDDLNEELTEKENKDSSDNDVDVSETGRLFVRNLPFTVCEEDLMNLFSPFGDISEIHVPLDDLKRPKGFAFVHYSFPEHAVLAMAELDSKNFQGRLLHIIPAKSGKPRSDSESILHAGSEYKQKKLEKLRSQSGREDIWNTLFVNSDTVVAAMAEKYGVSKSDIINPHSEESKVTPAVRVALAETQVISDTKTFLSENGICVDSFRDKPKERSKTVMLVKNLPTNSEESDLRRLFGRFGELGRLVLPPSRTVAVVEFLEPSDARKAFSGLAYKKFKDTPLYLEWAPISIFSKPADSSYLKKSISSETQSLKINPVDEFAEVSEENPVKGSTLFVKNLNFGTTEAKLKKAFQSIGPIRKVSIVKRKKNGEELSCGYGFIEFGSPEGASEALKGLQGIQVDGHFLQIRVAKGKDDLPDEKQSVSKRRSDAPLDRICKTKIIVKNLPFEANIKELKSLFGTFGQIKSCRLPKKFNGQHRGFAFMEFVSEQEAENAFKTLTNTHFYGRHLVLQWAKQDESVEEIREKTKRSFESSSDALNFSTDTKRPKISP